MMQKEGENGGRNDLIFHNFIKIVLKPFKNCVLLNLEADNVN